MLRLVTALVLVAAAFGIARADETYDKCIDASDGTNAAWSQCGSALLEREDVRLNAAWKRVYAGFEGQSKQQLLDEQRAWNAFKEKSCLFYANGDYGREGQVLQYPACRAAVIAERTKVLEGYGANF